MNIRERTSIYTKHGGSWYHLKLEFQAEGMSIEFSERMISIFNKKLGIQHSEKCLVILDIWLKYRDEKRTKLEEMLIR